MAGTASAAPPFFTVTRAYGSSLHSASVFSWAIGRRVGAFDGVTEKLDEVRANAELAAGQDVLNINLRSPSPHSVRNGHHFLRATTFLLVIGFVLCPNPGPLALLFPRLLP